MVEYLWYYRCQHVNILSHKWKKRRSDGRWGESGEGNGCSSPFSPFHSDCLSVRKGALLAAARPPPATFRPNTAGSSVGEGSCRQTEVCNLNLTSPELETMLRTTKPIYSCPYDSWHTALSQLSQRIWYQCHFSLSPYFSPQKARVMKAMERKRDSDCWLNIDTL